MLRAEQLVPVDVRGQLRLVAPSGRGLRLLAEGSGLRLEVPGWQEVADLAPRTVLQRRGAIIAAARRLAALGLRLDIELQGHRLASLGGNVSAGWLGRLLRLGPVDLPVKALLFAWRRRAS